MFIHCTQNLSPHNQSHYSRPAAEEADVVPALQFLPDDSRFETSRKIAMNLNEKSQLVHTGGNSLRAETKSIIHSYDICG
jgi:hypothetical protein